MDVQNHAEVSIFLFQKRDGFSYDVGDISANFCSEFTYCCQDCDCNTGTNVRFIFQNTTSLTTKDPTARIESTVATAPTAISVASSNSLTSSASSFISSSHLPSLTLSTAFATSIPSVASSSYISTSRSSVSHSSTSSPSPLPQRRADLSKTIGIGVGVGVTGLVILLIAVMVWLIRRDRRWKTELKELRARWIPPVSFLHHSSQPQPMQELDSSTTAELHADHLFDQEPHEMNANHPWGREASELSADHSVKRASHN